MAKEIIQLTIDPVVTELLQRTLDLTSARLIRIMNKAAGLLRDRIKTKHLGAVHTGTDQLARNTGKMETATVARRAIQDVNGVSAQVAVNRPYASIHFGVRGHFTTIRPVTKRALTVPLPGIIGPNKRALFAANSRSITGKFARNGVLHGKLPGDTQPRRLFSLRQSVAVPVRIDVKLDLQDWIQPQIEAMIEQDLRKVFES